MLFELLFSPFVMSVQSCCVVYAVVMSEYGSHSLGVGFAVRGLGSTGLVLAKMVSLTSPIKLSRSRFRPASSRPCCSSVYCSPSPGQLLLPLLVIRRYLGARNGVRITQPRCKSQTQQDCLLRRIASIRRHHVQSSTNFYSAPGR